MYFLWKKVSFLGDIRQLTLCHPTPKVPFAGNSHGFQLPKGCFWGTDRYSFQGWKKNPVCLGLKRWGSFITSGFRFWTKDILEIQELLFLWEKTPQIQDYCWQKTTQFMLFFRKKSGKQKRQSTDFRHCFRMVVMAHERPTITKKNEETKVVDAQSGGFLAWWWGFNGYISGQFIATSAEVKDL